MFPNVMYTDHIMGRPSGANGAANSLLYHHNTMLASPVFMQTNQLPAITGGMNSSAIGNSHSHKQNRKGHKKQSPSLLLEAAPSKCLLPPLGLGKTAPSLNSHYTLANGHSSNGDSLKTLISSYMEQLNPTAAAAAAYAALNSNTNYLWGSNANSNHIYQQQQQAPQQYNKPKSNFYTDKVKETSAT